MPGELRTMLSRLEPARQMPKLRGRLPSCVGAEPPVANAATIVAGRLTTTPAAAARPILLCIGIPVRVIKMFVRMPPPTPAKPEDKPIAAPATIGNLPPGGRSVIGRNRLGKANRAAKIRQSRVKSPVILRLGFQGRNLAKVSKPQCDANVAKLAFTSLQKSHRRSPAKALSPLHFDLFLLPWCRRHRLSRDTEVSGPIALRWSAANG